MVRTIVQGKWDEMISDVQIYPEALSDEQMGVISRRLFKLYSLNRWACREYPMSHVKWWWLGLVLVTMLVISGVFLGRGREAHSTEHLKAKMLLAEIEELGGWISHYDDPKNMFEHRWPNLPAIRRIFEHQMVCVHLPSQNTHVPNYPKRVSCLLRDLYKVFQFDSVMISGSTADSIGKDALQPRHIHTLLPGIQVDYWVF